MFDRLVADGDRTTTGGYVIARSRSYNEQGKAYARKENHATCGNCKGGYPIYGTANDWMDDGFPLVKDLDRVLCPCGKNFVLAASSSSAFYSDSKGEAMAAEPPQKALTSTSTSNAASQTVRSYDEQIRIVDDSGCPAANCPFHITDSAGKTYQGLTDENGLCPRVYTNGQKTLDIAVGLKALERWEQ